MMVMTLKSSDSIFELEPVMIIRQDIPILAVVTLALGLGVMKNGKISRLEGIGLLLAVTAYLVFVVVRGA